jgi:hypothetical protein
MAPTWQEIDGSCQSCHSWQDLDARMITAMTVLLILSAIVLVATIVLTTIFDPRWNSERRSQGGRDPDPYDTWLRTRSH